MPSASNGCDQGVDDRFVGVHGGKLLYAITRRWMPSRSVHVKVLPPRLLKSNITPSQHTMLHVRGIKHGAHCAVYTES